MTVTYIKQRDRYRCGPIAIINALRWAGKDISYKSAIKQVCQACDCAPPHGTPFTHFDKALRKQGKRFFKTKLIVRPTLEDIETSLHNERVLVWNFKHIFGRHYAMITDVSQLGKTFGVANFGHYYDSYTKISRDCLKQILRQNDRAHCVWVLSRIKK